MSKPRIPYQAYRFLRWFCKPSLFEEISGDLEEEFYKHVGKKNGFRAKIIYWLQVFSFFRPFAIGLKIRIMNLTLFKNHSLIAYRVMKKHKLFTSINVFGLTLRMIIGILLITIIIDQKSFDKFHKNGERIYRITTQSQFKSFDPGNLATTAIPLANELNQLEGIEEIVRIRRTLNTDLSYEAENKTFPVYGHFADANFFRVFTFPLLSGNPVSALKEPYSLVVTKKLAGKIFNGTDILGHTVRLKDLGMFTITGVLEDLPRESHMQFELLASFSTVESLENQNILWPSLDNWQNYSSSYLYFLAKENADINAIQSNLDQISKYQYKQYPELDVSFHIQPLWKIALGKDMSNQIGPTTELEFIIGLSIMATIIFFAAIFNYTNLSVARSLKRSREVGLRKVMGSTQGNIVAQFVLESCITAFLAMGIALLFFELLKPVLLPYLPNSFLSLDLTPKIMIAFVSFALLAGMISGIAPSIIMNRIKVAEILKHNSSSGLMKRINFRKGILVFQFTLSMIFIVVAIVAWRQYRFGITYDTGFKKENIFNISIQGNDPERVKAKFSQLPEVADVSFSEFVMASGTVHNTWVKMENPSDSMLVNRMKVDENYTRIHEIQLLAGKRFSPTGGYQAMVNKYILDYFRISDPNEVLGRKLIASDGYELEIVAVTTNFFHDDVGRKQGGFYLHFQPDNEYSIANLAVVNSGPKILKSKLENTWKELDEGVHDFHGDFFLEQLKESYSGLTFIFKLVATIAFFVISIAGLGLLGIVIYSVEQRTREIGIRKAMGAGERKIAALLSSGFLKLVLLAGSIAIVISYFLVFQVILTRMVDKPSIGIPEFLTAFVILLIPSLAVILPAVLSAARTNPAIILRTE